MFMRKILEFSFKNAKFIIIAVVIITIIFSFFAIKIRVDPSPSSLIPDDNAVTELQKQYDQSVSDLGYFFVAVESEDLFTIEKMRVFEEALREVEMLPGILPGLTPFNAVSFEANGSMLKSINLSKGRKAPGNEADLEEFKNNIIDNPFYSKTLISEDNKMLCAIFPADLDISAKDFMNKYEKIKKRLTPYFTVYTTGDIPLTYRSNLYLTEDFYKLGLLALAFVLITFYIGFRAMRAIFLPILVVIIGTIWTLGFMSLANFSLSIISIILPPIVLTIGSSYTIHMLNQYYREYQAGKSGEWIIDATLHISKTIFLATITTVVSFLSLLATSIEQCRQFGIAATVGIVSCFLMSIFFLPAILALMPSRDRGQKKMIKKGWFTHSLERLGYWVNRLRYPLALLFIGIIVTFALVLPHVPHQSDYLSYFPNEDPIISDTVEILKRVGGYQELNISMTAPNKEKNYFMDMDVLKNISDFEVKVLKDKDISTVSSLTNYIRKFNYILTGVDDIPDKIGLAKYLRRYLDAFRKQDAAYNDVFKQMANEDYSVITLTFKMYNSDVNRFISEDALRLLIERIETLMEEDLPAEYNPVIWSYDLRFLYLSQRLYNDQKISMLLSIVLVFLITIVSFRSLKYSLAAIVPLCCGLMLNYIFMAIFQIPLDMITLMVSNITIGVGVDYSIHYLLKFKSIVRYDKIKSAIMITHSVTGRPIMHTTLSIVFGLSVLLFANYKGISYFGLLVLLTLFFSMVGTLVFLPAIVSIGASFYTKFAKKILVPKNKAKLERN